MRGNTNEHPIGKNRLYRVRRTSSRHFKDPFKSGAELKMADVGKGLMGCGCAIPLLGLSLLIVWAMVATMFEGR